MNIFKNLPGIDGAHCGLSDLYPDRLEALTRALNSCQDFTTGWYSSKKELASACIAQSDGIVYVTVSVSDDFDTPGLGEAEKMRPVAWEDIESMIDKAWQLAEENRKENQDYRGFSIRRNGAWVWTYLQAISDWELDCPPGDCGESWGFNYCGIDEKADTLTDSQREKIEEWIAGYPADDETLEIGQFTIKPWE